MEKEKVMKKVLEDLKKGEPFSYIKYNDGIVFGFREEVDKDTDEIQIFYSEDYLIIYNKFIKKFKHEFRGDKCSCGYDAKRHADAYP